MDTGFPKSFLWLVMVPSALLLAVLVVMLVMVMKGETTDGWTEWCRQQHGTVVSGQLDSRPSQTCIQSDGTVTGIRFVQWTDR